MQKAAATALKSIKKLPTTEQEVPIAFKEEFVDKKLIEPYYLDVWKRVEDMQKLARQKKFKEIPDKEVYEMREYVRKLIRDLAKVLKEKGIEEEEQPKENKANEKK